MLDFFKHIKFWGPFLVLAALILIAELILRTGVWDNQVKPRSYLGHGVYREKAVLENQAEPTHWVSIGNSVLDWGLNHQALRSTLKTKGINYTRMSMGGSRFPAVQMTTDWAVAQMPELKGIVIGANISGLGSYNLDTQYKIAWPFLAHFDGEYQYSPSGSFWESMYKKTALYVFFEDLKDYVLNHQKRQKALDKKGSDYTRRILNFNKTLNNDVCGHALDTLADCVQTTQRLDRNKKLSSTEKEILKRCPATTKQSQLKNNSRAKALSEEQIDLFATNWIRFLTNTANKTKQVHFLIIPEHPMLQYTTKPSNLDRVYQRILNAIKPIENIQVHDLRNALYAQTKQPVCAHFNDAIHLSELGQTSTHRPPVVNHQIIQNQALRAWLIRA